jgi:hypothetical protein
VDGPAIFDLSVLVSEVVGRCSDELEAPRRGCVKVSLGCRGVRAARPSEREENIPFCLGSSDILRRLE